MSDSVQPMDDEEGPRLSWRDLATREESELAFPGSRLVEEKGYDEGEGWFDPSVLKGAGLYRGYLVDADGNEVLEWFRTQLANRGWEAVARPLRNRRDDDAFYARGPERFAVRVLGRDSDFPPGTHWLPPLRSQKGLYYDIMLMGGPEVAGGDA